MNILIAPNAFKNSLAADEVALAIKHGLDSSRLSCNCVCFPVADGGDGTSALLVKKLGGINIATEVHDALGRRITAPMGLADNGQTAVIEMADASGIRLLRRQELNPLRAVSYGTGEQVKLALDRQVKKIIIAMGGSATVDGGAGILSALGVRFLDAEGHDLAVLPRDLVQLAQIDLSGMDQRIFDCQVTVLCDVDNVLLGEHGAAAIFGPQKGATANEVVLLEQALSRFSAVAAEASGIALATLKYGGTAGGAAAGLHAFLGASLVQGIDYFLEWTGFDKALDASDLVITGEGSIDEQTLQGKGPYGVAARAKAKDIPVIAIAGKVPLTPGNKLYDYFDVLLSIGHEPAAIETALHDTKDNLVRVSRQIGNLLKM